MMDNVVYRGRRSDTLGLYLDSVDPPIYAKNRREAAALAGMTGFALSGVDADDPVVRHVVFFLPDRDASRLGDVYAWLSGGMGDLILPDDPTHRLRAVVLDEITPVRTVGGLEISVMYTCQPWRYRMDAGVIVPASGGIIPAVGSAPSLPRITVTVTGDGSLTVGGTEIGFVGATGSVVLDSEAETCAYAADGSAADAVVALSDDAFPVLDGVTTVSWSGGVTGISVEPRWRDR